MYICVCVACVLLEHRYSFAHVVKPFSQSRRRTSMDSATISISPVLSATTTIETFSVINSAGSHKSLSFIWIAKVCSYCGIV